MKTGGSVTLRIPGRLPSLNDYIRAERANRYKGAALKRDTQHEIVCEIRRQLRGVRIDRPVFVKYVWVEKNRRRDLDNVSAFGHKVIQDALVESGILPDDGWNNIVGYSDSFRCDGSNPHILVTLEVL